MKSSVFVLIAGFTAAALAAPTAIKGRDPAAEPEPQGYANIILRSRSPAPEAEPEPQAYSNIILRSRSANVNPGTLIRRN
ncbi:hypothetical protein V8F33_009530 [Rhypophila sp. PSN 637]